MSAYTPVTPREHDPACRRGQDPTSAHYGVDRERCERCRALWQRILDAQSPAGARLLSDYQRIYDVLP